MFPRIQCRVDSINLRTCLRRLSAKWIWLVLVLSLVGSVRAASPFYDFKIIAKTGDPAGATGYTLQSIKPSPSINDNGRIAFIGVLESSPGVKAGEGLFRYYDGTTYFVSRLSDVGNNKSFGSVWLNNQNQLATTFIVSGNPSVDSVRRYPGANSEFDLIATGGAARDQFGNAQHPFDNIFNNLSMNNAGAIVFSGQVPFTTITALTNSAAPGKLSFGGFLDLRPAIDNDGCVVLRSGSQTNSPILLWNSGFTSSEPIATGAGGFTRMGQSPGITDSGGVVAFYAEDVMGPGIFVSTNTGISRIAQPIVRIDANYTSFIPDSRVGIAAVSCGLSAFTVTFLATSNDKLGLYTVDLNLSGNPLAPFTVGAAKAVVTQGDIIYDQDGTSLAGTVQSIAVFDPLDGQGELAFWIKTSTGIEAIVLANPKFKGSHQCDWKFMVDRTSVPELFGNKATLRKTCDIGCALCSVAAMLATFPGFEFMTPRILDDRITSLTRYNHNASMPWCNLYAATGRMIALVDSRCVAQADLDAYLEDHFCHRGHRVLLHLRERVNGSLTDDGHWVFVTGRNGMDWQVFDPGWSHTTRIGSMTDEPEILRSLNAHFEGFVTGTKTRRFEMFEVRTYKLGSFPTAQLCIQAHSPVELTVTDPLGHRLGWNSASGNDVFEMPEASYFRDIPIADDDGDGPSEGDPTGIKTAFIPIAAPGVYHVEAIGTGSGDYTLNFEMIGPGGGAKTITSFGTTTLGAVSNYFLTFPSISSADLAVGQSSSPVSVGVGSNLTFTISITNNGPDMATEVTLIDPLPTWAAFVSASASQGTVTQAFGTVRASLNDLASGAKATVSIVVSPTVARPMTNTVNVLLFEADLNLTNNTATQVVSVLGTNRPPRATNDFALTTNGSPATIDVLANDFAPDGVLDPSTVTISRAATNGTASVNLFTGAITYTPNPGTTNRDTFRYTVRDDLGTLSAEAVVTVTNLLISAAGPTLPEYLVLAASDGASDHRYPRINNRGEIVYQDNISGLWQVWKKPAGDPSSTSASQLTFSDASYSDATSPALADDGSFLAFRNQPGSPYPCIVFYSAQATVDCSRGGLGFFPGFTDVGAHPSLSSNGKEIYYWTHQNDGSSAPPPTRQLAVTDRGSVTGGGYVNGDWPDLNASGSFTYENSGQIYLNNSPLFPGHFPNINDAPRDSPDIVYVNGSSLVSRIFGTLQSGQPNQLTGSWVDVNRDGILAFEQFGNGHYQIFKAYPWEPRIVSFGGTNALVGLPYRYDSDNIAEAYGGPEEGIDPRGATPIQWSVVSGPPGFTIDSATGLIQWVPQVPGTYVAIIRASNYNDAFMDVEDLQTITITVAQSAVEAVDAVDFGTPGTSDLPTVAANYATGGTPRIGTLADGASRLLLRVTLVGAETNSFPNLHFTVAGTNQTADGLLRSITSDTWSSDVPAAIATVGSTNLAVCLYESSLDFDAASQPVIIHLLNRTNVIATQSIQLRRPPVVLVHDGWSGPDVWPLLYSQLLDVGMDVYLVDYAFTSGSGFNANEAKIFLKSIEAVGTARQSGFAASRVDLVGHGTGGIMARLHAQRYAAQDSNYRKGDVHKLITFGTPHAGSWLAEIVTGLRTNNPAAYSSLRSAVMAASQAKGDFPAIDLDAGLLTNSAPGSIALAELNETTVPSHAIATTANGLPPGDIYGLIQFFLGLTNRGDGCVTPASATGGIASNAATLFAGVPHSQQPFDTNITTLIVGLLQEPIALSNRFAFFPANSTLPAGPPSGRAGTNIGNWLNFTGATNGQTFAPGQTVNLTAVASNGHALQSVYFLSPSGSALATNSPFDFSFQIPSNSVGRVYATAAALDAAGQAAFISLGLNVLPTATLVTMEVEPPIVVLTTKTDFPLRVWGVYDDGLRRDITLAGTATKYRPNSFGIISVNSNGVLHWFGQSFTSPVTISVTNGSVWTNVQVTLALTNLPPTAVIVADRLSGPAPFDVQFTGENSRDANGDSLTYLWDFGDGTIASGQIPPPHRFVSPGNHVVSVLASDPFGLGSVAQFPVSVEPRLVMIDSSLTLTQRLAFDQVIITNGGQLQATKGLDGGDVRVASGSLTLGERSAVTSINLNGGQIFAPDGLDGGVWGITNGTLAVGGPCTNVSLFVWNGGLLGLRACLKKTFYPAVRYAQVGLGKYLSNK